MGKLTAGIVTLLFLVELLVIFGAVELRSGTVAKYAPWAYNPFLKLVGEHPGESGATNEVAVVREEPAPAVDSILDMIELPVEPEPVESEGVEPTRDAPEEEDPAEVAEPAREDAPPPAADEVMPVG